MQSLDHNGHLAVALSITACVSTDNSKYYTLSSQWTDGDSWNPASKFSTTSISVSPADLLLNIITEIEVTMCNRILIEVANDELLKENLKVLTGQSVSKTKSSVLNQIAFNPKEKAKLSSLFRVNNIEVI